MNPFYRKFATCGNKQIASQSIINVIKDNQSESKIKWLLMKHMNTNIVVQLIIQDKKDWSIELIE